MAWGWLVNDMVASAVGYECSARMMRFFFSLTYLRVVCDPVGETPWDCDRGVAGDVVCAEVLGGSAGASFEEGLAADVWA